MAPVTREPSVEVTLERCRLSNTLAARKAGGRHGIGKYPSRARWEGGENEVERETVIDTRDSLSVRASETRNDFDRRSIINTVNDRQGKRRMTHR